MRPLILALCVVLSSLVCVPASADCSGDKCSAGCERPFPVARKILRETGRRVHDVLRAVAGR